MHTDLENVIIQFWMSSSVARYLVVPSHDRVTDRLTGLVEVIRGDGSLSV